MKRVTLDTPIFYKGLHYGLPGSTKTRTSCTAALDDRMAPALYINSGGNPLAIRDYEQKPDMIELEKIEDLNWIYKWLKDGQPDHPMAKELGLDRMPYKTLIFDGVSHFQQTIYHRLNNSTVGSMPEKPTFNEHGAVLRVLTMFAHSFFQLPMHVIVTALEYEEKIDETGKNIRVRPMIAGQSAQILPSYAYVIARIMHASRIQGEEPKLYAQLAKDIPRITSVAIFKPDAFREAKDQYNALGAFMIDPTMTKIMDLIEGG